MQLPGPELLIDGQWVAAKTGEMFPSYNPATGEVIMHIARGGPDDINQAVEAAINARTVWNNGAPTERVRLMLAVAREISRQME